MNTSTKLPSVECKKTYGYSRTEIEFFSRQIFYIQLIPGAIDAFSNMFLLFWEKDYLLSATKNGIIERDGIAYTVVFHPHCSRGSILRSPSGTQYSLSFRAPAKELGLQPVALVKAATTRQSN